jgi:hypothetical protein
MTENNHKQDPILKGYMLDPQSYRDFHEHGMPFPASDATDAVSRTCLYDERGPHFCLVASDIQGKPCPDTLSDVYAVLTGNPTPREAELQGECKRLRNLAIWNIYIGGLIGLMSVGIAWEVIHHNNNYQSGRSSYSVPQDIRPSQIIPADRINSNPFGR